MAFEMNFGNVESLLSTLHNIASEKRATFQARLKNFHKLNVPVDVKQGRGRPAIYRAGELIELAFAVELTQMGLTPDRAATLLHHDPFAIYATVQRSAAAIISGAWERFLRKQPEAGEPTLLYFDPRTLSPLSTNDRIELLWAGAAHVGQHVARATSNPENRRLEILNVTALMDALASLMPKDQKDEFLAEAERWARIGTEGEPERGIVGPWEKQ